MDKALAAVQKLLMPHLILIQVLASRFQAVKYREPGLINVFIRVLIRSCIATKHIRYGGSPVVYRLESH